MPKTPRKPVLIGSIALGLVVLVAIVAWWMDYRLYVSTDDAYVHADIAPIAPKVAGYVAEVAVSDHQAVKAGDVLIRLVDDEYRAKAERAEALVAARAAALDNIGRKVELQRALVAAAEAEADAAGAERKRARLDQSRVASLREGDYASRQKAEASDADLAKAEAATRGAAARIDAERSQLDMLDIERRADEAELAEAKAGLALARQDLENTVIRAPVAGLVGNRAAVQGQYVRVGAILMSVVPIENVWVEANFKETQLARMVPGQPATIRVDAYPGVELQGTVDSLAPASGALFSLLPPENASGNFTKVVQRIPVKILIPADNPLAGRLRPGLSVVATVATHHRPGAD